MLTVFIGFMDALFMIILVFFGCIFSITTDDNQFYSEGKLYQFRL